MNDIIVDERDMRFYKAEGDPDFSPERNAWVVEQAMLAHEKKLKEKEKEHTDGIEYRTNAVASYLKHVANGKEANVDKYFGRRELAKLRGRDIQEEILKRVEFQKTGIYRP